MGSLVLSTPSIVHAASKTVYKDGVPLHWNYGRKKGVYGYSELSSQKKSKHTNVNGKASGWKKPHEGNAYAEKRVGKETVRAYWDAK